ncbi:MAG: helix-turn-helix transcriptional regulator, partial [Chloroflexi bacterium]|nr:helix-turn-helix transcriptional regulator [Chloroflexota bacterium]
MRAILFTPARMSTRSTPDLVALRLAAHVGITIAEARRRRRWTLRELAARAGVSASSIHAIEHGRTASLETYAAIALALDPSHVSSSSIPECGPRPSVPRTPSTPRWARPSPPSSGDKGSRSQSMSHISTTSSRGVPTSLPGIWVGGPSSTSRTGRVFRTCRRRSEAVPPGVVGNERSVVMLSDGVGGVGQDASRTVFARSTSLVEPS